MTAVCNGECYLLTHFVVNIVYTMYVIDAYSEVSYAIINVNIQS